MNRHSVNPDWFSCFMALIVGTATAGSAIADPPKEALAAGYSSLIFSDDFDTLDLGLDGKGSHRWYGAKQRSVDFPHPEVEDSKGIVTIRSPAGDAFGLGASIQTYSKYPDTKRTLFQFGYFEARMRVTEDRNNWAAFWLMSADHDKYTRDDPTWPRYCEIDIAETGVDMRRYSASAHDWIDKISHQTPDRIVHLLPTEKMSNWNVYGLLWRPRELTFYLNGRPVHSVKSPSICDNDPVMLILSGQKVGGVQQQAVDVDWVHVYR